MYPARYIQYLNFPRVPQEITRAISTDLNAYNRRLIYDNYTWSDDYNQAIDAWGKSNICPDMYYAFQMITGDLPLHKDTTPTKLNYVVHLGGNDVKTEFYSDDEQLLASYLIPAERWHVFKADTLHRVVNLEPGQVRLAITARIFGDN